MARPLSLYVFCYDIRRDSVRNRVASRLGDHMVRVQMSVFEGRLTNTGARRLAGEVALLLGPDDSLRCYCITEAGREASLTFGGTPLAEDGDFWLL